MARVLFISYDGLLEPLGDSQVAAYLTRLAGAHEITLLSYEKPADLGDPGRLRAMAERLERCGIRWLRLRYHRRPAVVSTAWDVVCGLVSCLSSGAARRAELIHARGYVPALMAAVLAKSGGAKWIFDMRGFWADEKTEGGHWPAGSWLYRLAKRCERWFVESASAIVSLTHEGAATLRTLGYRMRPETTVHVITTCTDLERFHAGPKDPALTRWLDLEGQTVIGCSGSMSHWYLRREMLETLALLVRALAPAKALVVTQEDHAALRRDAAAAGLEESQLVLARAEFGRMPSYLRLMDAGLFFIRPCFSKKGSAATKLGEFLATGVPVIINDGVGDSGAIVRRTGSGIVVESASRESVEAALPRIRALLEDAGAPRRCREAAEREFALEDGLAAYGALYASLVQSPADAPDPVTAEVCS